MSRTPGVRVVMDVRALQEPARAPRTAAYLEGLLGAFDAEPLSGESFAFLLASDEDDPTARFSNLEVIGRRLLPPIRLLRSAALTVDPFLLSGASIGAAWRAELGGAAGAVYHTAGGGLPIAAGLPTVATLLDLAPWELPRSFQRGTATRFGQRLRARLLRDAAAVLVGSDDVARAARRLLHLRRNRIRVVPLAPRAAYAVGPVALAKRGRAARAIADRLGLGIGTSCIPVATTSARTHRRCWPPWPPWGVAADPTISTRPCPGRRASSSSMRLPRIVPRWRGSPPGTAPATISSTRR